MAWETELLSNTFFLLAVALVASLIVAVLVRKLVSAALVRHPAFSKNDVSSLSRLIEVLVLLALVVMSLHLLQIQVGTLIIERIVDLIPNVAVFVLLLLGGYIVILILIKLLESFVKRLLPQDSWEELGVSPSLLATVFSLMRFFLFLVLLNISLVYAGFSISFVEIMLNTLTVVVIVGLAVLLSYSFYRQWESTLLVPFVRRKGIKPGQVISIDGVTGEVIVVSEQGVVLHLDSGFDVIVPNKDFLSNRVSIQRVHTPLSKLETVVQKFVAQKPSYCGPASASMILSFFGFDFDQEKVAQKAKTLVPGGNEPEELIFAVSELTTGQVIGALVSYSNVKNLRDELKGWLAEGALPMLWYKKPILFPQKGTTGHYVVCVGVEENEIVVLDPSSVTGGVYTVNYDLMEEAMDKTDKERGYVIFAKKGSSAFWMLSRGARFVDVNMYESISKGLEKQLRRLMRKQSLSKRLFSEHVVSKIEEQRVRPVWKPDLLKKKASSGVGK